MCMCRYTYICVYYVRTEAPRKFVSTDLGAEILGTDTVRPDSVANPDCVPFMC